MSGDATLLIVDDNAVNLELVSGFLRTAGYRVLVAADGESALEQARLARPDLVLMDVLLPGMSGFDATRKLHEQPENASTPVIYLTALSRTADKIEGFRSGGVDYLTKPLQFEEVLARVEVHLQLRRLQAEVEEQNEELQERDRRRYEMVGIIAHDLKSPMADLISGLRRLDNLDPATTLFAEQRSALVERAERMDRLLATLLHWGELQVRSRLRSRTSFLLRDLVEETVDLSRDRVSDKELSVVIQIDAGLVANQNRPALQTILTNLVSNAVKFSNRGGTVTIGGALEDGTLSVSVTDDGVGMSAEELELLLESEKRLQKPGTEGEVGTGLGMLLSRDLVSRLGGSIRADSEPGRGSRFVVDLPNGEISEE